MEITLRELREQFAGMAVELLGPDGSSEASVEVINAAVNDWIDEVENSGTITPILDYVEGFIAQDGPWCNECGCPCKTEWEDQGIGSYEFHGMKGNDTQMVLVTTCCDAVPYEDALLTIEYEGDQPDDQY